jgi:thiamine-monophosphate kinase
MGEFELIEQVFAQGFAGLTQGASHVALGIGDDCALLAPRPGMQLAISSDMLVEGRHFLSTVSPAALGHKALAVNLSDLAACGAKPLGFTLALAMPRADEAWLRSFASGLHALAAEHGCPLIGGDTTAGPLNICITVFGEVPGSAALLRSGAREGDDIWVSGTLGEARCALDVFRGKLSLSETDFAQARSRMERPTPRVALGLALRGVASAAADVSDGLIGDLGHILKRSSVHSTCELGCELELAALPVPRYGAQHDASITNAPKNVATNTHGTPASGTFSLMKAEKLALTGGDDYELVFTAAPKQQSAVAQAARAAGCAVSRIGRVVASSVGNTVLIDANGQRHRHAERALRGFDHFAS